jgi:Na+/H+ antiporter NhaC
MALNTNGRPDTSYTGSVRVAGLWRQSDQGPVPVEILGPFQDGKLQIDGLIFTKAGTHKIVLTEGKNAYQITLRTIPGWFSLLPPLVAILLALIFRQVFISLFVGIWLGTSFINGYNPFIGLLRLLDHYLINVLADPSHTSIVLFTLILGGMVGIISRSGGTQGVVASLSRMANKPRGGQIAAWAMGVFIFFDDYANTLIVGNTMRPITDRVKISREKLSFIVDSTAAPVVSVAVISTWVGFEMGLVQSAFSQLGIDRNIYFTYLQTIPYRFYCLLAILFVFIIAATGKDFGPMLRAERRARRSGQVLRQGSTPLSDLSTSVISAPEGTPLRWYNAFIPISVVILVTMAGLWYSGTTALAARGVETGSLKVIIGESDSFSVLMWSSFAGALTAGFLAVSQRILTLKQTLDSWVSGIRSMLYAMIVLILAWSIGQLCDDLHTADYVVSATRHILSPQLLPVLTFITAAFISFATGTSWGTMSILVPIVVPMAYKFTLASSLSPGRGEGILIATIAAVLSGAVFGDHCSPISDTTIMSSMASGSDHIDHVRTQIPYAVLVGSVAILAGYFPAGYGFSPLIAIPAGVAVITLVLFLLGRRSSPPAS